MVGSSISSSLLNVTTNEEGKKDSNLICEYPSDPSSSYEHYLSSSEIGPKGLFGTNIMPTSQSACWLSW